MDWKKLAPWNWFKKEEEEVKIPVNKGDKQLARYRSNPFSQFQNEMNRIFDNLLNSFATPSLFSNLNDLGKNLFTVSEWLRPSLDVSATENDYRISVELPGVEPSEIRLELQDDQLIITGEKKQEKEVKEDHYYRIERSYGSFRRVLSLPEDADKDKIDASFKNGIMTITITRLQLPQAKTRLIEVKAS